MKFVTVFITCANKKEAVKIARTLVKEKLAACGNIIDGLNSIYWWKGKIEEAKEALIICRTTSTKFNKLVRRVKELHSYEVPEIIALPINDGSKDYFKWIEKSIRQD